MVNVGISSGFFEELIFRAIVLRLLMRAFGIWPSLALSAALFGALHLANPNATPVAAIAIAVEAGLMLASFYLLTGRLWVSIGVHAAWNFAQGWIWGARVSGIEVKESLYLSAPKPGAPEWLSGGAFGPEASVPSHGGRHRRGGRECCSGRGKKGNFKARPDAAPAGRRSLRLGSAGLDHVQPRLLRRRAPRAGARSMAEARWAKATRAGGASSGWSAASSTSWRARAWSWGAAAISRAWNSIFRGVAVVFGPRGAPAAPVVGVGDDDRIGAGIGVVQAVALLLPLVAGSQDAPVGDGHAVRLVDGIFRPQLACLELASQPHVVGDAHGFVEALGPDRHDLVDRRPGADAVDPHLLVPLEDGLGHAQVSLSSGPP
jgi:hypothetical protein